MQHAITKMTSNSVRYWQEAGYWTDDPEKAKLFPTEDEALTMMRIAKGDGIQYFRDDQLPGQVNQTRTEDPK